MIFKLLIKEKKKIDMIKINKSQRIINKYYKNKKI